MVGNLAVLRSQIEASCAERVVAPFGYRDRKTVEVVSTGIPQFDAWAGGLPRGSLTEISSPVGAGNMSFLTALLAARTSEADVCALVDGRDAFDPRSAEAAGVNLDRLLWVRCRNIDQALRSTDLLIQGGGFGVIALDLSDIAPEMVRHVPLNAWFRFRRAVEDTQTVFLVLDQEPNTRSSASLALRLEMNEARWTSMAPVREGQHAQADAHAHTPGRLLGGFEVRAEILRSRIRPARSDDFQKKQPLAATNAGEAGLFRTAATWNSFRGLSETGTE